MDNMDKLHYERAKDFDRAWLNFELDLPLRPTSDGKDNPFYVSRFGNPLAELKDALMAPFYKPPKFFFSGHRGCGKSTELLHLVNDADIQKKYWPINFTIRNYADIIDLDFRDVLLAIGGRLFIEYKQSGGELPDQLLKELDSWKGKIEQEIGTIQNGRLSSEIGAGIDAFFANAGVRMKLEPATRVEIRQTFEKDVTGLIAVINAISSAIYAKEKRFPLVLIDDLDKPELDKARAIFHDRREIMTQPNCAIVYTVSSALFYSKEFDAIRDQAVFLPNINIHTKAGEEIISDAGYGTLRKFIDLRMSRSLIDGEALDQAIKYSGGVFREMARIMRTSIGRARRRNAPLIEMEDVEWTATEIRNEYRRILNRDDIKLLKTIYQTKKLEYVDRLRPLLQLLAILEYRNGDNWCDIHPVLRKLINE